MQQREPSHSGRLLLRMPQKLHAQLAARSDADGVSLNQYIVDTLTRAVSSDGSSAATDGAAPPAAARPGLPRAVRLSLAANAVVVALAAGTAIALLVIGLR